MFRKELAPDLYIVDGILGDASENPVGSFNNDIAELAADRADRFGFAVVRNSLTTSSLKALEEDCQTVFAEHDMRGWTQKVETTQVTRVDKTPERRMRLPERSSALIGDIALQLHVAAEQKKYIETDHSDIAASYILRMHQRGQVGMHRDPVTGVMCETVLQGRAMMTIKPERGWVAHVLLKPNDTLIMPGYTSGNVTSQRKPVKHNVLNVTNRDDQKGTRISLFYNYGRRIAD